LSSSLGMSSLAECIAELFFRIAGLAVCIAGLIFRSASLPM
jgi:hypothetical protein